MSFFTSAANLQKQEREGKLVTFTKSNPGKITQKMRAITVDWIAEVCDMFKLKVDTFFQAINMLDICMQKLCIDTFIDRSSLQLYSVACLMVAAKKYELYSPEIEDYVYVVDGAFMSEKLQEAEITVFKTLGSDLEIANIIEYNRHIRYTRIELNRARGIIEDAKAELVIIEIVKAACMYWFHKSNPRKDVLPSVVATASFFLAEMCVNVESDVKALEIDFSDFSDLDILNPFCIEKSVILYTCKNLIKVILDFKRSSLKAVTSRIGKKLSIFSYDRFINTIESLSKAFERLPALDMTGAGKMYLKSSFNKLSGCKLPTKYINLEDYEKVKSMGSGAYGAVHFIKNKNDSKDVHALKKVSSEHICDNGLPAFYLREVSVLLNMKHENIVKLTGVLSNCRGYTMELMDSDLKSYYDDHPDIVKIHAFQHFTAKGLLSGLEYMHANGIMNRDIKPQNVLVRGTWGENFEVKFCDFGLCRGMGIATTNIASTSEICTLWYRPIEILLRSRDNHGPQIDVWSLACTLFETFTCCVMFRGDCEIAQILAIFKVLGTPDATHPLRKLSNFPTDPPMWKNVFDRVSSGAEPYKMLKVIKAALEYDPVKRPSAGTLLKMLDE